MYARHSLAWLSQAGWQAAIAAPAPDGPQAQARLRALAQWRQRDWPLIVRRRDADARGDDVCLGLALPPDPASGGKTRIALRVPRGAVRCFAPPLPLAELPPLPPPALPHIAALQRSLEGLPLRVYGSLALQALTGQPYVTPRSDIDLLLTPADGEQLAQGLRQLQAQAGAMPLDGEIMFPGGAAVAWKEWLQAGASGARVLVKRLDAVRLERPEALLATLERR